MSVTKVGVILFFVLSLSTCALSSQDKSLGFSVKGVVFFNNSAYDISELKLKVARTGGIVACGYIPVGGECSTTFPAKDYKGGSLTLTWNEQVNGELIAFSLEQFLMPMPERMAREGDYKAIFHLGSEGLLDRSFI